MAVISLKLPDALNADLTEQARLQRLSKSELIRRALNAFLQPRGAFGSATAPSACDLVADLVGSCEGAPADLSTNAAHLDGFAQR
jgi:hypothetical protein